MTKWKRNNYKFWHSPIALILLFFFLLFFGYRIIDLIKKERETSHQKELILDKIDNLKQKEISLKQDISKLSTNEGVEEVIRDKYQVVKPNEKMVTIVDEEPKNNGAQEERTSHGFWNWIKNLFDKRN